MMMMVMMMMMMMMMMQMMMMIICVSHVTSGARATCYPGARVPHVNQGKATQNKGNTTEACKAKQSNA